MDFKRIFLYCALIFVGVLLYDKWQTEHPAVQAPSTQQQAVQIPAEQTNNVPSVPQQTNVPTVTPPVEKPVPDVQVSKEKQGDIITVKTDILNAKIDTLGGKIINVSLLNYPERTTGEKKISLFGKTLFTFKFPDYSDNPFTLLNNHPSTKYIAESGLTGKQGPDLPTQLALYQTEKTHYVLEPGQHAVKVALRWKNKEGLRVKKTFTFMRDSYQILMDYTVNNDSAKAWTGNAYALINRKEVAQKAPGIMHFSTYMGGAISSPDKHYQKIPFAEMAKNPLSKNVQGGWVSMLQHYFISAWVPEPSQKYHFYSMKNQDDTYSLGMVGPQLSVAPGDAVSTHMKFYAGPAIATRLEKVAPHLDLTVDYGWLWILSSPIFWVMQHIFNILGNWGWSIILVTLLIKLIFYPLSAMSYRSMAAMRSLQPKLQAIKERFGDDKQKISQATMELYRKEKVNPFSGCLPIFIQIPFFIALYYVLVESVQLRQAPFILWITDLSTRDPYFVLPVLMGLSMFLQQKLSPAPPDPTQAKVMMFLPVVFTVMFLFFPSGLVLYWLVNNLLSISQQWYVTRQVEAGAYKKRRRKDK